MVRPLTALAPEPAADRGRANWITQGTARAFGAAAAALLVATFVVSRSDIALTADGTTSGGEIETGTIMLTDDDDGRSLFDLADMVPGRVDQECIAISYDGSITPVDLALIAEVTGDLSPYLDVTVESGRNGGFGSCAGFDPEETAFAGTLAELAREPVNLGRFLNEGEGRTFRVGFAVQDTAEALGRSSSVGFVWEVTPA